MLRIGKAALVAVLVWAMIPAAGAQQKGTINWSLRPKESISLAQKYKRPLMFYVLRSSRHRDHDLERDQKRAFADPVVYYLSQRFVSVKLSQYQHRDLLKKWGLSDRANMIIVFTNPKGEKIDEISAGGVGNPDSLAQKMYLVFNFYRQQLYDEELRPTLENTKASVADLKKALGYVKDFTIEKADAAVIEILKRDRLDKGVEKLCYDVLAQLSTRPGLEELFTLALSEDRVAANAARKALGKCTPAAAEMMLPDLESDDPAVRLLAYKSATKICKVRSVKADRFWDGKNEQVKAKEIERVTKLVQSEAKRWRKRNEYR